MAFVRRETTKDATWARAWTADAVVDLASISAIVGPNGPRHGDIAFVTATGFYYLWMDDGSWAQLGENTLPTVAQGDLLYGSAASVIALLNKNTSATRYLSNQGTSNNPSWNQINLPDGVTGDLPDANLSANVPLLNAANVFTADQEIALASPDFRLNATGQGANQKKWGLNATAGDMALAFYNDDDTLQSAPLTVQRSTGSGQFTGAFEVTGLIAATGGSVVFPGTQVPSANPNALDDYEEGTWTPSVGGSGGESGQAYTTQVGLYTKVGRQVTVSFLIVLSNLGTITGNVQIEGMPFTSNSSSGYRAICPLFWSALTTAYVLMQGIMLNSSTTLLLFATAIATTGLDGVAPQQADLTNTSIFAGTFTYFV